jgi:glycosyltransferase involved in cell wall biosynthesis
VLGLKRGMKGVGVPSRFYNYLAAGKPVISVSEKECEISRVVGEENVGWVCEPGNGDELVRILRTAMEHEKERADMGRRARRIAEEKYGYSNAMERYLRVIADVES